MLLEVKTNNKIETYHVSLITALKNNRYISAELNKNDIRFGTLIEGETFYNQITIDILKSSFEIYEEK